MCHNLFHRKTNNIRQKTHLSGQLIIYRYILKKKRNILKIITTQPLDRVVISIIFLMQLANHIILLPDKNCSLAVFYDKVCHTAGEKSFENRA
jgi:hypothetical protein